MSDIKHKPLIRLDDVSKYYLDRDTPVVGVADVNLEIQEGEFLAIVGHSGSGKTTILDLISGLLAPTNGRVLIRGSEVHGPQPDSGFVFQDFSLFPWRTVRENVEFGLEIRRVDGLQRHRIAMKQLELVSLQDVADSYPHILSGGMKQRVAIARALAYDPGILLMDEPFGSLDAQTRDEMQEELLRLWRATSKTIIFVTHSIREAVFLAQRVVLLRRPSNTISQTFDVPLHYPRDVRTKTSTTMNELIERVLSQLQG